MEITDSILIERIHNHEEADKISRILHDVWGVRKVEVNRETNEAVIVFNDASASLLDFEQALIDGGFQVIKH